MQTITTKYVGPTNSRGSRVIARTTSGVRRVMAWDYARSQDSNHREAAHLLAEQLGWAGEWIAGTLNENGNVYVCVSGATSERGFEVAA